LANYLWPSIVKAVLKSLGEENIIDFGPALQLVWSRTLGRNKVLLSSQFDCLYPRLPALEKVPIRAGVDTQVKPHAPSLTHMHYFILLAASLASHNPPRTDFLRLYRSSGERGKKKGGGTRKVRVTKSSPISPQLLGPLAFNLDRLQAISGSLLAEHDEQQYGEVPEIVIESLMTYNAIHDLQRWGIIEITSSKSTNQSSNYKCSAVLKDLTSNKKVQELCKEFGNYLHDYEYK